MRPTIFFFFFNDTATTEIYTLSLHDALPISHDVSHVEERFRFPRGDVAPVHERRAAVGRRRSEEHTSELQSQSNLVCRLLLEKKKELLYRDNLVVQQTLHISVVEHHA